MDEYWPLTSRAIEESEPQSLDLAEEEPVRGNALLRALAAESGGRLVEISPGFWYESKIEPGNSGSAPPPT
jgi:hypothetical protein